MYTPSVIERVGKTSKVYDIPSKMLEDRIVFLNEEINEDTSNSVIMQLLWLASDNPDEPIDLYIKSPGGSVYCGLAIRDIIDKIPCKVNTIAMGMVASMGAYLLAAGTGTRKALKNSRIMIHSVSSGTQGTIIDMEVDYKETKYLNDKLMVDIANFSKGKMTVEDVEKYCQRDYYMSPDDAIKYGLIDEKI